MKDLWARAGFDLSQLGYAARTALAASLALVIGWALGLEHPQWSAMTVWAASQPIRGQVLEKSLFRTVGTVVGSGVGGLLVLATDLHPAFLVVGLALWLTLCTGLGNLTRGFGSYGAVLAGYTAAMVSLLDVGHPDQVVALGADRLATVMTGVLVATVFAVLFAPAADGADLRRRVQDLLSDLLDHVGGSDRARGETDHALLTRIAEADETLGLYGAGSIRSRRMVRATRAALIAAIAPLLWRYRHGTMPDAPGLRHDLRGAAARLRAGDTAGAGTALVSLAETVGLQRLSGSLRTLGETLRQWHPEEAPAEPPRPLVPHRDWIAAREAGLRAGAAILFFGAIWLATGWAQGAFMLLGLSVMLSLFSTFGNPLQMMRSIFFGQIVGVLGALACRWLIWPLAEEEWQLVAMLIPFIFLGALLFGHHRTRIIGMDYSMVVLLMSQPHLPLQGSLTTSLAAGLALIAAPAMAGLVYRLIYPPNLRRRQRTLLAMMVRDLADLARDPRALDYSDHWRARLYYRTLRLVRLSQRSARASETALEVSLALLSLGQAVLDCHEALQDPDSPETVRRAARVALGRIAEIADAPAGAERALGHLARRETPEVAEELIQAAAGISRIQSLSAQK